MSGDYKTIREFYENIAPSSLRDAVKNATKDDILDESYPYERRMKRKEYEALMQDLQIQLVRMQRSINESGKRIAVIFEGRDAAGKGGTIKRLTMNLNPRSARIIALSKPSDIERSQWYFQRYIKHLPSAGEMTSFDRSWYNRGVIEPVFGFCSPQERDVFFEQVPKFEQMLIDDNITFIKIWLTVSRPEQLRRFLARENDPLKQWKLSPIDIKGLTKWDDYTKAIDLMLSRTHTNHAPWVVIRSDDKKRARLEVIKHILSRVEYDGKDDHLLQSNHQVFKGINL